MPPAEDVRGAPQFDAQPLSPHARVIIEDIDAANGPIHVIDGVLIA